VSTPGSSALLQIRHVTGFVYDGIAESSYNEARMTPLALPRQRVIDALLTVHPKALQSTYRDYFDTIVTTFDLHEAHDRLEVLAEATVETFSENPNQPSITFGSLHVAKLVDTYAEYLAPTTRTTMSTIVLDELREHVPPRDDIHDTVQAVITWVRDRVTYVRGSTLVSSTAQEVWAQRQGVCQDLTHVTIALLRSLGIPSRYVSGYLHSDADASIGEMVVGESHAWVEYFCGDWVGIDPTNGSGIGVHHVIVAKGREYGDVPPLKGIYNGGPSRSLGVVVEITRVG
jgi:transglutaminase-like putative cysteine protease